MKKKYVGYLIIYLILATVTLTASVFAWFQLSKNATGFIDTNIPDFTNMITFEVTRLNGVTKEISSIDDMHEVFGDTRPGESYEFSLTINNDFKTDLKISIYIPRIVSIVLENENYPPEYLNYLESISMLDVFYIDEGKIITTIDNESIDNNITTNSQTDDFHENSLNKLINESNTIYLLNGYTIPINKQVTITFKLIYDINTTSTDYQNLMLSLGGIYVYAEQ